MGAQRSTLLIDIESEDEIIPAVAQLSSGIIAAVPATVESAVIELARTSGVPAPLVLAATDALAGTGQPAQVVSREPGLSIPRQVLRSVSELGTGAELAGECGTALARLHGIAVGAAPPGLDRLDEGDPFGDYCDGLAATLDDLPLPHPTIRLGVEWLRRNPPSLPQRQTIVHADFRTGNLLVDDGRLSAVVDWELAHVGDPMEDLDAFVTRLPVDRAPAEVGALVIAAYAQEAPERFGRRRLQWHLAVQMLLQASRAFVFQIDGWRDELERRLAALAAIAGLP